MFTCTANEVLYFVICFNEYLASMTSRIIIFVNIIVNEDFCFSHHNSTLIFFFGQCLPVYLVCVYTYAESFHQRTKLDCFYCFFKLKYSAFS